MVPRLPSLFGVKHKDLFEQVLRYSDLCSDKELNLLVLSSKPLWSSFLLSSDHCTPSIDVVLSRMFLPNERSWIAQLKKCGNCYQMLSHLLERMQRFARPLHSASTKCLL